MNRKELSGEHRLTRFFCMAHIFNCFHGYLETESLLSSCLSFQTFFSFCDYKEDLFSGTPSAFGSENVWIKKKYHKRGGG